VIRLQQAVVGQTQRARLAAEDDYRAGGQDAILEVLAAATRVDDPVGRALALCLAHHCLLKPDHGSAEIRRRLAVELIGESARTGRRSDLLMGLLWQVVDGILDGDPHVRRRMGELRAELGREDHRAIAYLLDAIDVMYVIRSGRLAEAEIRAKVCWERGRAVGDAAATGLYWAQLAAIRHYQGRFVELLPELSELMGSPTSSAVDNATPAAYGVAAALSGDPLAARSTLAALRGRDLGRLPRSPSWLPTMLAAANAALLLDDVETASRVYELLSPYAGRPVTFGLPVACFGSSDYALGLAASTAGHLDAAVGHFRAAVRDNLALGHLPALVHARVRHAEALTRRGGADDRAVAAEELATARGEAAWLGIPVPDDTRPQPADDIAARCARAGQHWRVEFGRRTAYVRHRTGMPHLAVLLANPGRDIPAVDLVAGVAGLAGVAGHGRSVDDVAAQPLLDRPAIEEYRRRTRQLRAELDELAASGLVTADERARATTAAAEHEWLIGELAAATGFGGRPRAFPTDGERARLAVTRAIHRAVRMIAQVDETIGTHLERTEIGRASCRERV